MEMQETQKALTDEVYSVKKELKEKNEMKD